MKHTGLLNLGVKADDKIWGIKTSTEQWKKDLAIVRTVHRKQLYGSRLVY